MKRRLFSVHHSAFSVFLILSLALVVASAGCAKSPSARWAQARDGLTAAQNALVTAHRAGAISDKDFVALDPFSQAARGALDQAQQKLPSGGDAFNFYLDLTENVLKQLSTSNLNTLHKE